MPGNVKANYAALVAAGKIERDPEQENVLARLSRTRAAAERASSGAQVVVARLAVRRARAQAGADQGLYLFGDVGRGKTMLMDLFFEASPVLRKRRAHFHEFMADVHERLRGFRAKLKSGEIARRGSDPAHRRVDRR